MLELSRKLPSFDRIRRSMLSSGESWFKKLILIPIARLMLGEAWVLAVTEPLLRKTMVNKILVLKWVCRQVEYLPVWIGLIFLLLVCQSCQECASAESSNINEDAKKSVSQDSESTWRDWRVFKISESWSCRCGVIYKLGVLNNIIMLLLLPVVTHMNHTSYWERRRLILLTTTNMANHRDIH
jgi:hypothetical protein